MTAAKPSTAEQLAKLRTPFLPTEIGKLPKPYRRDAPKSNCRECGGYHGLPAAHLDYVGHAALTNRMLEVDPEWNWEPFAVDEKGLPLVVNGNLWIRLTICGVTRIGVGDAEGQSSLKIMIGDALRNAGMRFGMALDLWSKEDLHDFSRAQGTVETPPEDMPAAVREASGYEHSTLASPPRQEAAPETRAEALARLSKDVNKLDQADRAYYQASWQEAGFPKLGELSNNQYIKARQMLDLLQADIANRSLAQIALESPASAPDYDEPGNDYYSGAES